MTSFTGLLQKSAEKLSGNINLILHPERCFNTRFRMIDCTLCADMCPANGAIVVADGKPTLDTEICLSCDLCLHRCPTEAFTRTDGLAGKLVKTVAALPIKPMDLVCPQHPHPEHGSALQAVQTQRCLAALSPATLLELSTLDKEIWLDDTHCAECPLGQVHPAIARSVNETNSWGSLLEYNTPIRLRTGDTAENRAAVQRSVYDAATPPVSRRGLFGSLKQAGQEVVKVEEKVQLVKTGKSVPVSERLPYNVPYQRAKILSIIEEISPVQSPNSSPEISILPVLNLHVDAHRCTACTLCAKFCPTGALKFLGDGESFALIFQVSICLGVDCNICMMACPEQAVSTQQTPEFSSSFGKRPLAAGDLTSCQQCKQPIAQGANLPNTCFACRPRDPSLINDFSLPK